MDVDVICPGCGEPLVLFIDLSGGRKMEFVEDCEICCRPMQVRVVRDRDDRVGVDVRSLDR